MNLVLAGGAGLAERRGHGHAEGMGFRLEGAEPVVVALAVSCPHAPHDGFRYVVAAVHLFSAVRPGPRYQLHH